MHTFYTSVFYLSECVHIHAQLIQVSIRIHKYKSVSIDMCILMIIYAYICIDVGVQVCMLTCIQLKWIMHLDTCVTMCMCIYIHICI